MVLLPYASKTGLGSLDDEILARIFGQTMAMQNALPDFESWSREIEALPLTKPKRIPRTTEQQREYWRRKKQEERLRKKMRGLYKERAAIDERIKHLKRT